MAGLQEVKLHGRPPNADLKFGYSKCDPPFKLEHIKLCDLAELVCSNSLGSNLPDRASGVLKNEMRMLGSMLLECAEDASLPAGGALAVDRELFARLVTERIHNHANIEIIREEAREIPSSPTIIASGPLTSPALSKSIADLSGEAHLFFFDAIAPVIHAEFDQYGDCLPRITLWHRRAG